MRYLDLKEAAAYLNHSEHTLRKVVDRSRKQLRAGLKPEIRFAQAKPKGKVLFLQEWLDDYVRPEPPQPVVNVPRPKRVNGDGYTPGPMVQFARQHCQPSASQRGSS